MNKKTVQAQPVKVRVEGDEIIAKAAILALKQAGFNIKNLSKFYPEAGGVRFYLEICPQKQ